MRGPVIVSAALVLAVGTAVLVLAQLTDSQTASGTVTVSSTAADLYICEPDSTPGPDCGSDDSGADEAVFETLENIRPGGVIEWNIRIKNTGTQDFLVAGAPANIVESADPGADCPDDALQPAQGFFFPPAVPGVLLLGKAGDPINDNPAGLIGVPSFRYESFGSIFSRNIKVAAGDYEDLRLQLQLPVGVAPLPSPTAFPTPTLASTEGCAGNEWNVSFVLTVI